MFKHPLYQALRDQVERFLPLSWGESLRNMLVWAVIGVLDSESASPARIAQALSRLGMSGAKVSSLERRVRRLENEPQVQAATCFHPFARHHLCLGKPRQLVLAIDPTTQAEHVVMLTVSVNYRGRSLPLAWTIWAGNVPLTGARFWERVAALLTEVAPLLPVGIPIIWLADRAFGTPQFTDLVVAHGWHYLVRVQGHTRCRTRMGQTVSVRSLVSQVGQRRKLRGQVFKKHGWRQASVVVYWGQACRTPLCLVSDLPPDWELLRVYRHRYTLEALFRDYKSAGWHWEQAQVRDLDHLQRLLVLMALATWCALLVGSHVAQQLLAQPPSGKRRTPPYEAKRSLFHLGLQRLQRWLRRLTDLSLAWAFADWDAPPWHRQLYHHHAYAFVFA